MLVFFQGGGETQKAYLCQPVWLSSLLSLRSVQLWVVFIVDTVAKGFATENKNKRFILSPFSSLWCLENMTLLSASLCLSFCSGCFLLPAYNRKLMFKVMWGQGKGLFFPLWVIWEREEVRKRRKKRKTQSLPALHWINPLQSAMFFSSPLYCFIVYFGWVC